jgi:hypothetical protein
MGGFIHNQSNNKGSGSSLVFAKRKPAFKIRIDGLCNRGLPIPGSVASNAMSCTKKSVRIAENHNTVLFRHVLDSELKQAWYQSKDYNDFQRDSRGTLDAFHMAQGQLCRLDPQYYCLRGLEAHVSAGVLEQRQSRIRTNVQVVLDQQQFQRFHGIKDPDMVANVSRMFSKNSRQHALSMGALDNSLRGC